MSEYVTKWRFLRHHLTLMHILILGSWDKQTLELSLLARAPARAIDELCTRDHPFYGEEPARTTLQLRGLFTPTTSIFPGNHPAVDGIDIQGSCLLQHVAKGGVPRPRYSCHVSYPFLDVDWKASSTRILLCKD